MNTETMAMNFTALVKADENYDLETNAVIYEMQSIVGAVTWGKNTPYNSCPVISEFYCTLAKMMPETAFSVLSERVDDIPTTFNGVEGMKKNAQILLETVKGQSSNAEYWVKQATEKFNLENGLLEEKHLNSFFHGNQYVFVAYAIGEALKADKNWDLAKKCLDSMLDKNDN